MTTAFNLKQVSLSLLYVHLIKSNIVLFIQHTTLAIVNYYN